MAKKSTINGEIIKISTADELASRPGFDESSAAHMPAAKPQVDSPQPNLPRPESPRPDSEESTDRANHYSALGALLAAPASDEHCAALRALPAIEQPQSPMEMAWTLLRSAASEYSAEQIDDEYHQLFVGLGRGIVVPYGSWHITGFLMEKPLGKLRVDLRKLGIERTDGVSESEDHIASLCQAMAAIIVADEIDFTTQRNFFNDHIAPWADDFFTLVEDASCAGFYRAVGLLGKSFIDVEKQYLGMTV